MGAADGYAEAVGGFTFQPYGVKNMTNALTLFTINETAGLLRVHRSTVSRLISTGALGFIAVGSRRLIPETDLLAFIENRRSLAANSPKGE